MSKPLPLFSSGLWQPPAPAQSARELQLEEELFKAKTALQKLTLEMDSLKSAPLAPLPSVPDYLTFGDQAASAASPWMDYSPAAAASPYHYPPSTFSTASPSDLALFMSPELAASHVVAGPTPDNVLLAAVLNGMYNFFDMPLADVKPTVCIIANRQPKSNLENTALKTAVSHLAQILVIERGTPKATTLIDAVVEFAQPLCFTSCGNYLCQQLIERGELSDKKRFVEEIKPKILGIASDKFGTHVLCKAIGIKELDKLIIDTLLECGTFESMKSGARRLWREHLERCHASKSYQIFHTINASLAGKWADLACVNEHGSIAVQQVFEIFGSVELMQPCFDEIMAGISRIANNQFGHYLINKLISNSRWSKAVCEAILGAYPPVGTHVHGAGFVRLALNELGRPGLSRYMTALCSNEGGRTPGIVSVATSSIGKGHLSLCVMSLGIQDMTKVRQICRDYSTTLRNSQSGNDFLRSLGLIQARPGLPKNRMISML